MPTSEPADEPALEALKVEPETAEKPRPKSSAIDAAELETRVSVLRTWFLQPMKDRFQAYLKMYRLDRLMPDVNLEAVLETAFLKVAKLHDELSTTDEEALVAQIIKKMVGFFCRELNEAMARKNYFVALQYLIMAHECARIGNTEIGTIRQQIEYFELIKGALQDDSGNPQQLLISARHLLPDKIARNYIRRSFPVADTRITYDAGYRDVTGDAVETLDKLDEEVLLKYAWSALEDGDFDKAIVFSYAALKSNPAGSNAYVFLAKALGKKGFRMSRETAPAEGSKTGVACLQAALAIRLIIVNLDVITNDEMQCRNNMDEIGNIERKIDLKNPAYDHENDHWPDSYHEFYRSRRSDTASCPSGILIRYSRQARTAKEFLKCLFFQKEVVERQPHTIGTLFALLTLYEHMEMSGEALAVRRRIYELFPSDTENKLRLRAAGEIERLEAQSRERAEKFARGEYVNEIGAALARCREAEQAVVSTASPSAPIQPPLQTQPAQRPDGTPKPTEKYPRAPGWNRGAILKSPPVK